MNIVAACADINFVCVNKPAVTHYCSNHLCKQLNTSRPKFNQDSPLLQEMFGKQITEFFIINLMLATQCKTFLHSLIIISPRKEAIYMYWCKISQNACKKAQ